MGATLLLATVEEVLNAPALRHLSQRPSSVNPRDIEWIEMGIASFSERVENHIDRKLKKQSYTQVFSMKREGMQEVLLKYTPIDTDSVVLKESYTGDFSGVSAWAASQYYVDGETGVLTLRDVEFQRGIGSVQVTYDGGYAFAPEDLKMACITQIAFEFRTNPSIGVQQEGVEGGSATWMAQMMLPSVLDKIRPYRFITVR